MNTYNPYTDHNGIYEEYGNHVGSMRLASPAIPMGRREVKKANPANPPELKRLTGGSLELGPGQTITAAALLSALDRSGERDAVSSAIAKFGLLATHAAHVLAARAYVWAKTAAPRNFAGVPQSGDSLEAVSEAITLLELARPGTLYFALQGDEQSIIYLNAAAQDGLSDAAFLERRIQFAGAPIALQTTSTSARAVLGLQPNNNPRTAHPVYDVLTQEQIEKEKER